MNQTPGQIAYEAYRKTSCENSKLGGGWPPQWSAMSGEAQIAWEDAANAVMAVPGPCNCIAKIRSEYPDIKPRGELDEVSQLMALLRVAHNGGLILNGQNFGRWTLPPPAEATHRER